MGGKSSKQTDAALASATAINNNVSTSDSLNAYSVSIYYMLIIITVIKVIELVLVFYKTHQRGLKKKYANNNQA